MEVKTCLRVEVIICTTFWK